MTLPSEPDTSDPDPTMDGTEHVVPGTGVRWPRPRRVLLLSSVALVVLAVDLVTKVLAVRYLEWRPPVPVADGLVYIQLVRNPGAAFGMATGMTWLLTLIAVGVVVAIVRVAGRLRSRGWAVALGLVLGGALGNLVDRLVREPGVGRGHVVDFIAYGSLFIGNVADIAIVAAAALMALLSLRGTGIDGHRLVARPAAGDDLRG
jgi:signal peptidase II